MQRAPQQLILSKKKSGLILRFIYNQTRNLTQSDIKTKSVNRKKRKYFWYASLTVLGSGGGSFLLLTNNGVTRDVSHPLTIPGIPLWHKWRYEDWGELLEEVFPIKLLAPLSDFEEYLTTDYVYGDQRYIPWTNERESAKAKIWEWLFPWEQSKSDDPWLLLELTKSSNFWIRQMGVASLAGKEHWPDYKCQNVAQACHPRTTVALARYPHASDAFFLPPPRLHAAKEDILMSLRDQLSQLPVPALTSSISYFRALALDAGPVKLMEPMMMEIDVLHSPLYDLPGEVEQKKEKSLMFCLEALLAYTAVGDYARMFVENLGLAVLQRLHEDNSEEWVQVYIAAILAQLSQYTALLGHIVHTGWVYVLRKWASCSHAHLSLLALTALANLDKDWISQDVYQDMILMHPTQRNTKPAQVDVVFVHGLRGGAVMTWRQKDGSEGNSEGREEGESQCWPRDWLAVDCPNTRIISIGYNSSLNRWGDYCPAEEDKRTLQGRGQELLKKLKQAGVGRRPIVWVGHSMGGLLIKQILALSGEEEAQSGEVEDLKSKTRGIIMYSVPHGGSTLADVMSYGKYVLFPSVEVEELLTSSPSLHLIHEEFLQFVSSQSVAVLSFGETEKTTVGDVLSVMVVDADSSDPGVGEFVSLPADHINTCKPTDPSDTAYLKVVEFIQEVITSLPRTKSSSSSSSSSS